MGRNLILSNRSLLELLKLEDHSMFNQKGFWTPCLTFHKRHSSKHREPILISFHLSNSQYLFHSHSQSVNIPSSRSKSLEYYKVRQQLVVVNSHNSNTTMLEPSTNHYVHIGTSRVVGSLIKQNVFEMVNTKSLVSPSKSKDSLRNTKIKMKSNSPLNDHCA